MNARTHKQLDDQVSSISDVELLILIKKLNDKVDKLRLEYQFRRICQGRE